MDQSSRPKLYFFVLTTAAAVLCYYIFNNTGPVVKTFKSPSTQSGAQSGKQTSKRASTTDLDRPADILTDRTIDFLGLFLLTLDFHETIEDAQTTLSEYSSIELGFGTVPIPFFNVPLIPTLKIKQVESLVDCDTIIERRKLNCQNPSSHVVDRTKKDFSKRWKYPPEGRLVKRYDLTLTAENHNGSFDFEVHELNKNQVETQLLATLRKNNLTSQLVDFMGGPHNRIKSAFGYNIQGRIYMDERHQYACGGNIYSAFNITSAFSPLRGDKFPRYASHIRYLLDTGSRDGMILTVPDFACKKLDTGDTLFDGYRLVTHSAFGIDFVRSQYFPYTTLNAKSSTLPHQYVLDSLSKISQSLDETDPTKYKTMITIIAHSLLLIGDNQLNYYKRYVTSFNDSKVERMTEYLEWAGLPGSSILSYLSSKTNTSVHYSTQLHKSIEDKLRQLFTWFHVENHNDDHISLTLDIWKDWKLFIRAILDDFFSNMPSFKFAAGTIATVKKVFSEPGTASEDSSSSRDDPDEVSSGTSIGSKFLKAFEIDLHRLIVRSQDKLRLLRDTRNWRISLSLFVGYDVDLKKFKVTREEQLRHCDDLPHRASLNPEKYQCTSLNAHIKNDRFRSLGIDTKKFTSDRFIKYYTLKIDDSSDLGSVDIFPYTSSALDSKIDSLLASNNLTELGFIEDHFRFGGHVTGRFSSKRRPQHDFTLLADIVWVQNRSANVFNDDLALAESVTMDLLTQYQKRGLRIGEILDIDRLINSIDGHLIEISSLKIRFETPSGKPRARQRFYSNATFITRQEFPFIYYNQELHSQDRSALDCSGTIKQTKQGSLYNTTYNIISRASGEINPLGSFLFNRTVSSNRESSQTIADQMLFFYPHFNIWFMSKRGHNDTTGAPWYYGRFLEDEEQMRAISRMATNKSLTDVSLEPKTEVDADYWTVKFKVLKNVYEGIREHVQLVNRTALSEQQQRIRIEDLISYVNMHAT